MTNRAARKWAIASGLVMDLALWLSFGIHRPVLAILPAVIAGGMFKLTCDNTSPSD